MVKERLKGQLVVLSSCQRTAAAGPDARFFDDDGATAPKSLLESGEIGEQQSKLALGVAVRSSPEEDE